MNLAAVYKRQVGRKFMGYSSAIAMAAVLMISGAAMAREHDRAPAMHVSIPEAENVYVRPEQLLARTQFILDESDPDTWDVLLTSYGSTFLEFDFANDVVVLDRSITDMPNYNSSAFRQRMVYRSYDSLGLETGSERKLVTVYSNPYFMWVEVSQSPHIMSDVRTALFFVGPPALEHELMIDNGELPLYDYNQFKNAVQGECADRIRLRRCQTTDLKTISVLLQN